MKKTSNKLLSLLLVLIMTLSCVTPVLAEGGTGFDNSTTLADGEYEAPQAELTWSGGTGKVKLTLNKVVVAGGKATAEFTVSSANMTYVYLGTAEGEGEIPALYDPETGAVGQDVYAFADKKVTIPVRLNEEVAFAMRTEAMSNPHWINYTYTITVTTEPVEADADYTAVDAALAKIPADLSIYTDESVKAVIEARDAVVRGLKAGEQAKVDAMAKAIEDAVAALVKKPVDGRVDLTITNNTGMFNAVTAYLETKDGKTTLVMALSSSGYHELYKGTYEQAVANGDNTDNWVHGYQNAEGKWEFRIPIEEGETYVPCVAISNSYYQKYLNGQNALERSFFPRQFTLDREARTLVTGDYEHTQELTVTNNVKMFKVSGAALETVGGPNSNGYKASLLLTMGSDAFDKAYVGRANEVEENAAIAPGEGRVFTLLVKWVEKFGKPETLKNLLDEPFIVSFHSVGKDAWYERQFTVSEKDGTLVIDEVLADYSAVDAALEKVPSDEELANYTDESVQALKDAIAAVKRGLTSKDQDKVDAMAKAIEDALAGLTKKEEPQKVVYTVVSGGDGQWAKGSGKDFEIVVKRSVADETTFSRFTGVLVDGKALDKANYEAVAGSVKVTLKSAYLETLSAGKHTVTVTLDDGQAETSITIAQAGKDSPKTGDNGVMLWAAMAVISAGAAVVLKRKKDEAAA